MTRKTPIDITSLTIEHDAEIPVPRAIMRSKWAPLFDQLLPGSRIPCEADQVDRIQQALRKAIAAKELPALVGCAVLARQRCKDGRAGVFVVKVEAEDETPKTHLVRGTGWPKAEGPKRRKSD
jgi:hypothetical protein